MKWQTNEKEQIARYTKWHVWRAWHPVKIDDTWYWFENVLRRSTSGEYVSYGLVSRLLFTTWDYKPHYIRLIGE